MRQIPEWARLGGALRGPIVGATQAELRRKSGSDVHLSAIPTIALHHFAHATETSIETNELGRHAVSISLLRHGVEALTLIDLGLVDTTLSYPLLRAFDDGKRTHGELRRVLETEVWPAYGTGLWNEPWSDFYGQLARAVQPYAHSVFCNHV